MIDGKPTVLGNLKFHEAALMSVTPQGHGGPEEGDWE